MKITSAEFVISNTDVLKCPNSKLPEYAFIGRSNVGKSSLINNLTGKKKLAMVSGKPGKTRLINHFLINKNWHLVDLPGYGYAKVSKTEKKKFQRFIESYFEKRHQLVNAFVLVDLRHEPQPLDLEFMQWLGVNAIPFSIIFTKADKLKPKAAEKNLAAYQEQLLTHWEELPPYFVTSSQTGQGKEDVLNYIDNINQSLTS